MPLFSTPLPTSSLTNPHTPLSHPRVDQHSRPLEYSTPLPPTNTQVYHLRHPGRWERASPIDARPRSQRYVGYARACRTGMEYTPSVSARLEEEDLFVPLEPDAPDLRFRRDGCGYLNFGLRDRRRKVDVLLLGFFHPLPMSMVGGSGSGSGVFGKSVGEWVEERFLERQEEVKREEFKRQAEEWEREREDREREDREREEWEREAGREEWERVEAELGYWSHLVELEAQEAEQHVPVYTADLPIQAPIPIPTSTGPAAIQALEELVLGGYAIGTHEPEQSAPSNNSPPHAQFTYDFTSNIEPEAQRHFNASGRTARTTKRRRVGFSEGWIDMGLERERIDSKLRNENSEEEMPSQETPSQDIPAQRIQARHRPSDFQHDREDTSSSEYWQGVEARHERAYWWEVRG